MAVRIYTATPQKLLASIKSAIEKGHITTWSCTSDGDFTHATSQWKNKAWLRPKVFSTYLLLNIIRPKDAKVSAEAYAIYHGRFIEMALAHFDKDFSEARAGSMPESGDLV